MAGRSSLFYIPVSNIQEARKISRVLLREKLIACANILPKMHSSYWWNGKIASSNEVLLLVKAPAKNKVRLQKAVAALHSYEVPCIAEFRINSLPKAYAKWLSDSTAN